MWENWRCASKCCSRHANARRKVVCAPWKVGGAPANVVRGMQMRVEKLPGCLGKLAVRQQTLFAACKCASEKLPVRLETWRCASKRCSRHANAHREVACAPWKAGGAPANVVRGMQMRVEKLPCAPWKVGGAPANVVRGMQMRIEKLAGRRENWRRAQVLKSP